MLGQVADFFMDGVWVLPVFGALIIALAVIPVSSLFEERLQKWTVIIALPIVSLLVYCILGDPNIPSHPFETRPAAKILAKAEKGLMAEQPLIRILETDPRDEESWKTLGEIYIAAGRLDAAKKLYSDALHYTGNAYFAERILDIDKALEKTKP